MRPEEILVRCGWPTGRAPPAPWEGAKVWVEIPEQVPLDIPVQVVVGLEVEAIGQQAKSYKARLALCPDKPGIVVEGAREWPVVIRSGTWVTVTATLRFTRPGEFAVRAAAYHPATGRVSDGGQRTIVKQGQERGELQILSSGWVKVTTQTFEGVWPSAGWTVQDLSNDGYTRYWDDDNYRPYQGNWAACRPTHAVKGAGDKAGRLALTNVAVWGKRSEEGMAMSAKEDFPL